LLWQGFSVAPPMVGLAGTVGVRGGGLGSAGTELKVPDGKLRDELAVPTAASPTATIPTNTMSCFSAAGVGDAVYVAG